MSGSSALNGIVINKKFPGFRADSGVESSRLHDKSVHIPLPNELVLLGL